MPKITRHQGPSHARTDELADETLDEVSADDAADAVDDADDAADAAPKTPRRRGKHEAADE